MTNKIIVAIVAALVVVAVPTLPAAEAWDKPYDRQSYIAFVAMLLTYNQHCASLPDHTKNQVDGMAATLDLIGPIGASSGDHERERDVHGQQGQLKAPLQGRSGTGGGDRSRHRTSERHGAVPHAALRFKSSRTAAR